MGCSSCSSNKVGVPAGCRSNGSCQTGCGSMLDVYDWLSNVYYVDESVRHEFVEVKFKGTRKGFYRNHDNIALEIGDRVVVEAHMGGHDVGIVSLVGPLIKVQMKKNKIREDSKEIRKVYRVASENDLARYHEAKDREYVTMMNARTYAIELGLAMKISDVEYQGDNTKATFYYTADGRVDFRELIKSFARNFKVKVEMRQIGLRQEAGRLGGIGSCGRELCCSTWLTDFQSVPTTAARYQNLFLNPLKLSGQCGRLKCCLNYELDTYLEALEEFPEENVYLKTAKGTAKVVKTDILKRIMYFVVADDPTSRLLPIDLDDVKELLEKQAQGKNVVIEDLEEYAIDDTPDTKEIEISGDIIPDDLDRFERKQKTKKKRKKPNNRNRDNRQGDRQQNRPQNEGQNSSGNRPQRQPRNNEGQNDGANNQQRQPRNNEGNRKPKDPNQQGGSQAKGDGTDNRSQRNKKRKNNNRNSQGGNNQGGGNNPGGGNQQRNKNNRDGGNRNNSNPNNNNG
ncbi:MAG: hypothetical protein KDC92_04455 [Bacteroidetes bacterium]|nr:hypothetical protein [Bacteroidota bacterium]